MVPTEVLAYQHKETLDDFFRGLGFKIEILVASLSQKEKKVSKGNQVSLYYISNNGKNLLVNLVKMVQLIIEAGEKSL